MFNVKCSMIIIWDFNGTLLDDTQVCVDCMNIMLRERQLPELKVDRYREIFTFPVREYYLSLGFNFLKEPFEIPAHRFIDLYRIHLATSPLHEGTRQILQDFKEAGIRQFILSAMEHDFLIETLKLKGLMDYFEQVAGIENHLADGKLDMARRLISSLETDPEKIVMIGDTAHDHEVAKGSGIRCILVAHGHQSYERLKKLDCRVVRDFKELLEVIA